MAILRVSLPPVVTGPLPDPPRKRDQPEAKPAPAEEAAKTPPAKKDNVSTQARGLRLPRLGLGRACVA